MDTDLPTEAETRLTCEKDGQRWPTLPCMSACSLYSSACVHIKIRCIGCEPAESNDRTRNEINNALHLLTIHESRKGLSACWVFVNSWIFCSRIKSTKRSCTWTSGDGGGKDDSESAHNNSLSRWWITPKSMTPAPLYIYQNRFRLRVCRKIDALNEISKVKFYFSVAFYWTGLVVELVSKKFSHNN